MVTIICADCGIGVEVPPRNRRLYCEDCLRKRANARERRRRAVKLAPKVCASPGCETVFTPTRTSRQAYCSRRCYQRTYDREKWIQTKESAPPKKDNAAPFPPKVRAALIRERELRLWRHVDDSPDVVTVGPAPPDCACDAAPEDDWIDAYAMTLIRARARIAVDLLV